MMYIYAFSIKFKRCIHQLLSKILKLDICKIKLKILKSPLLCIILLINNIINVIFEINKCEFEINK